MAASISELIKKARSELASLTGLEPSSTLGAEREGEGWVVSVEMVEKHSLPDQLDILADYQVSMDADGNITSFIRKGMRRRMDVTESEEE
jgi:hypothetical protein